MISRRSSGVLAHITSLPSPYGIGDIGTSSYSFIDFLISCNQSYWQFLPTGPTNSHLDDSPYMSTSAFAGSPLIVSPDLMYEKGLISNHDLHDHPEFSPYTVNFEKVRKFKKHLIEVAYQQFKPDQHLDYSDFVKRTWWLDDYALFMSCKKKFSYKAWFAWPKEIASRNSDALKSCLKNNIELVNYFRFEQYLFFQQWKMLKDYASRKHISLFGDLPIYVAHDSVDVWANQGIFTLNPETFQPTHVAGVPPDYFSDTGQRWGNPLYDWQNTKPSVQTQLLDWWAARLKHIFSQVNLARIDHFRGFESYWSIPENEETAIHGKWLPGPGHDLFTQLSERLGTLPIVAEDLGIITTGVEKLRDRLGFPGMKVLQFAFDNDPNNHFLPHNFKSPFCIVYTGTHDNETTVGWYLGDALTDNQRITIKAMVNRTLHDKNSIHRDLMYLAQASISKLCIFPLQDILGFGNDCKMNSPGTSEGNWKWRCANRFLNQDIADYMKTSTELFGRGRTTTGDKQLQSRVP